MSDLSPEEKAFLSTIRKEWGPSEETKDAVLAGLPAALRTTPELPELDAPGAPPPGAGGASRGAWAGAGLVLAGMCVVGLAWLRGSDAPVPTAPPPQAATVTVTATAALPPGPAPAATTTDAVSLDSLPNAPASPASARPAASPASAPAASGDTLGEELALLRTAQTALRSGSPNDALTALSTHASRFPRGALREERMTLQVLALCDRGDVAAARATRTELEKLAPGSSHLQRLSTSCAAR